MYKPREFPTCPQPLLDANHVVAILDRISLFGGLTGSQLHALLRLMHQVSYQAGETIFHVGEPSSAIYIVLNGAVRLVFPNPEHPLSRMELRSGESFGETSVVGVQPHSATAKVTQDAELLMLEKETLMTIFAANKELFSQLVLNIARETSRRLHRTNDLLADCLPDWTESHGTRH